MAGFLRKVYDGFDTSDDIEPTAWREVLRSINEATVNGLSRSFYTSHEDEFLHAIRHSNEVFSAFKVHDMGQQMAARLIGADGKLKPFAQWAEEVKPIASHHVGAWLQTEYDTAVIRAHNAADWKRFERDSDIYPNLRWMPTQSPNPEGSHQRYWQQKLTLPVEHPFWREHHPGDRWSCKCSLEQTDEPATPELIDQLPDERPQRGLENNMGKDGHTFSQNHPYFPDNCAQCSFYKPGLKNRLASIFRNRRKDCYNCPYMDGCIDRAKTIRSELRERAKQIRKEAQKIKDKPLVNPGFGKEVMVTTTGIKEWLNQPHEHFKEKNEMLLNIRSVFSKATYLGITDNHKRKSGLVASHIFETKIGKDSSWIIVHQTKWGEYHLYSISDSSKIKEMIKK